MMRKYIIPALLLALSISISLLAGNSAVGTGDILAVLAGGGTDSQRMILFQVRLPRIAAAVFSGAGLSVSGFLLQGSLDNRIASPGILGINNGAGLFVLLSACLFPFQAGIKCFMAFLGALLVTFFVYGLAAKTGMSKTSVVLAGVAVSALCASVTDCMISWKPETVADKAAFQIGGFFAVSAGVAAFAVPLIAAGLILSYAAAPAMDILSLGDETAYGLGLHVKRYRGFCLFCAALLAGGAISMGGLIGFVGLIVPNCVRSLRKENARTALFFCAIYGSLLLLMCDTLSRLVVFPYELPCGLFLSIAGGPFLIITLYRKRKRLGID